MLVRVQTKGILKTTPQAVLYIIKNHGVEWFAKGMIRKKEQNAIIIDKNIAINKGIPYDDYWHIPKPIEVIKNQQPIDELKYQTTTSDSEA